MQLRYGTLADYAGEAARGKLTIVGTYDTVYDILKQRPIVFPPSWLVVLLEARVAEGSQLPLALRFMDDDGHPILPPIALQVNFAPQGPGRLSKANLLVNLPAFPVPELGEYSIEIWTGTTRVGTVPVFVQEPPPSIA